MSDTTVDTQTANLAAALKAKKALGKLSAKQVEAQDKLRGKYKAKEAALLASLTPEVAALAGITTRAAEDQVAVLQ
jgi:hypothetical protein